jgi:hypothetical protein
MPPPVPSAQWHTFVREANQTLLDKAWPPCRFHPPFVHYPLSLIMSRRFAVAAAAIIVLTGLAAFVFNRGIDSTPQSSSTRRRRRLVLLSPSSLYSEDVPPALRSLQEGSDPSEVPTSTPVMVEYWPTDSYVQPAGESENSTSLPADTPVIVQSDTAMPKATSSNAQATAAHNATTPTEHVGNTASPQGTEKPDNGAATASKSSADKYKFTVIAVLLAFLALLIVGVYIARLYLSSHRGGSKSGKMNSGDTEDPSDTDFPSIIDVDNHELMIAESRQYGTNIGYDCEETALARCTASPRPSQSAVPLPRLKCPKLDQVSSKSARKSRSRRGKTTGTRETLSSAENEAESPIVRQMKQAAAALNFDTTNTILEV